MSRIITIGHQFGSGGRKLGRHLAEELGIPYHDQEIVKEILNKNIQAGSISDLPEYTL